MPPLTEVQMEALRIVALSPGIYAAGIGYGLIQSGAAKTDRPRIKAQGAALIAARPVHALEKARLIHFRYDGQRRLGFFLTPAGERLLQQGGA